MSIEAVDKRWDGFLAQIKERFGVIMNESIEGCRALYAQSGETLALGNAWGAMRARGMQLGTKVQDTWDEKVSETYEEAGASESQEDAARRRGEDLQDYIDAVADAEARVERLTRQIADLLPTWSLAPVVDAIQAMRGVGFIVAVTVVAEVGDFQRFDNPRQLMAYLGLTPSEHSSGGSVRRGGITKAGSGLARRALIEGAWSYRMQARVSPKLLARLETLPQAVRDIAWKGQLRMCQRYRHLIATGKAKVVVITAIAREMVGFIWAIARTVSPAKA